MKNNIIIGILLLVIALLTLNTCKLKRGYANQVSTIDSLTLANQTLDSIKNKQNETILTQQAIIVDNTESLNKLTDSIFLLKKKDSKNLATIAYYKAITSTKIDSVDIPYVDTIAMKKWEDSVLQHCQSVIDYIQDSTITVPRTASLSTKDFQLTATVKKDNLEINSLVIPDTLQLRFVERKRFLARPTIEVQFFHSNSLISTTQSNSVIYKPKRKPFFQRVVVPVLIGVGTGLIIKQ